MGRVLRKSTKKKTKKSLQTSNSKQTKWNARDSALIVSLQNPNKLIDWTTLSPKMNGDLPKWYEFCTELVDKLIKLSEDHDSGQYFIAPIDPIKLNLPDYLEKVKNPMDLQTMRNKLIYRQYVSSDEFRDDFDLIYDNCKPCRRPNLLRGKLSPLYLKTEFDKCWNACSDDVLHPNLSGNLITVAYKSLGEFKFRKIEFSEEIQKLDIKFQKAIIRMIQLFEHTARRRIPSMLYFSEAGFNVKDLDFYLVNNILDFLDITKGHSIDRANSRADELEEKAREWGIHHLDSEPGFFDFQTQQMVSTGWEKYISQYGFTMADKDDLDMMLLEIYPTNKFRTPLARLIQFGQIRLGKQVQSLGSFRQTGLGMAFADQECALRLLDYLELMKRDEAKAVEMAIEFEKEAKFRKIAEFDKTDRHIPLYMLWKPTNCRIVAQSDRRPNTFSQPTSSAAL